MEFHTSENSILHSILHFYLLPPGMCISSTRLTFLIIEMKQHIGIAIVSRVRAAVRTFCFSLKCLALPAPLPTFFPRPSPRRCRCPSPSRLAVFAFPPAAVDREPSPQALKGWFPQLSLYAFRELLKLPSSAVLQGTLRGFTPDGPLVLRRRLPPFSPVCPDPRAFPQPLLSLTRSCPN